MEKSINSTEPNCTEQNYNIEEFTKELISIFGKLKQTQWNDKFINQYSAYKRILDLYANMGEVHIRNMKNAVAYFKQEQQKYYDLCKELFTVAKNLNPKFVDISEPKLQQQMDDLQKMMQVLEKQMGETNVS